MSDALTDMERSPEIKERDLSGVCEICREKSTKLADNYREALETIIDSAGCCTGEDALNMQEIAVQALKENRPK